MSRLLRVRLEQLKRGRTRTGWIFRSLADRMRLFGHFGGSAARPRIRDRDVIPAFRENKLWDGRQWPPRRGFAAPGRPQPIPFQLVPRTLIFIEKDNRPHAVSYDPPRCLDDSGARSSAFHGRFYMEQQARRIMTG